MASQDGTNAVTIYPQKTGYISDFLKVKYEREARRFWDIFYKRNGDRVRSDREPPPCQFFKDRHYLHREWHDFLQPHSGGRLVVLEVGCGAGNTVFPMLEDDPSLFVHACDFSARAVELVKTHPQFSPERLNAFVADVTEDPLLPLLQPRPPLSASACAGGGSCGVEEAGADLEQAPVAVAAAEAMLPVHAATMVFVLSAISPQKMPAAVANVASVLAPGGFVLVRDYAAGDLAQERLAGKEQRIEEHFYLRGDGTRAFYFKEEALAELFAAQGFACREMKVHERTVSNRARELHMHRRWIQAVFQKTAEGTREEGLAASSGTTSCGSEALHLEVARLQLNKEEEGGDTHDRKLGGAGAGPAPSASDDIPPDLPSLFRSEEAATEFHTVRVSPLLSLRAASLSREHQHTQPATGLMLWEASLALARLLLARPRLVAGRAVLELGCGCLALGALAAAAGAAIEGSACSGRGEQVAGGAEAEVPAGQDFSQGGGTGAGIEGPAAPPLLLVASDGDEAALELLRRNLAANGVSCTWPGKAGAGREGGEGGAGGGGEGSGGCAALSHAPELHVRHLPWGSVAHEGEVLRLLEDQGSCQDPSQCNAGFDIILGCDVVYQRQAVPLLMQSASRLLRRRDQPTANMSGSVASACLILCHMQRQVDEGAIVAEAKKAGLSLIDGEDELKGVLGTSLRTDPLYRFLVFTKD